MNYMDETTKKKVDYCLNCVTKPCQVGCPLENDIPSFIQAVKKEDYEKAYEILCETTVLQPVCGRICPHKIQCEGRCTRAHKMNAVSIGDLEAFVGDIAIKEGYSIKKFTEQKMAQKIAVVGGGPAGLSVAAALVRHGYAVTIYEKYAQLGGILRHGIPRFRLPEEVLDATISKILDLGIKVNYNSELGKDFTLADLQKQFDAIYLAFGANLSSKMGIEGEDLLGVYGGNELLEYGNHPDYSGKKVVVSGGGNVAMDTARTIKMLGAKEVTIIYRRAEEQMPAERKEIEDAKEEGIQFLFQNNILKIIGNANHQVEKIECIKTELVQKEGETRLVPINIEGSNYTMDVDYVVMAVGSKVDASVTNTLGLTLTKRGHIQINEDYMTSMDGVFAGGDLGGIKGTVAWASRSGRKASDAIMDYLK